MGPVTFTVGFSEILELINFIYSANASLRSAVRGPEFIVFVESMSFGSALGTQTLPRRFQLRLVPAGDDDFQAALAQHFRRRDAGARAASDHALALCRQIRQVSLEISIVEDFTQTWRISGRLGEDGGALDKLPSPWITFRRLG
jgi:hypothetical protein